MFFKQVHGVGSCPDTFSSMQRFDPKFSDRQVWANSADPDQTAPRSSPSNQGLHCLLFHLHVFDKIPSGLGFFV